MPAEGEKPQKSPEELRAEAQARIDAAREARNADRLARLEQIADSAETTGEHVNDEEVTDEMWADHDLPESVQQARAMAKAQAEKSPEEEPREPQEPAEPSPNDQEEEAKDDEARDAGADDVRVTNGVKEYRLTVNGRTVWRSLEEIRATAQKVESADEYLETATETVKRATRSGPSAEEQEAAGRERAERVSRRKELLRRQAMGDESAIEELAELDERAAPSAVTPDVLRALDERFDSRVSFQNAVNWFEGEYAPELKHQAMKLYAGQLDAQLAERNPRMAPKERLRRVGEQIRKELRETYGLRAPAGPSDKALRKAEVRRPVPAAERRQEERDEGEEETTAEAIQKMARARGQPRAVVHAPVRNR